MTTLKSDFLNELQARGFIHQATDEAGLDQLLRGGRVTGYIGFDATAPSLHVGNLVSIMMLRKLQQAGHKPIVLIGGGTTKVGDPSGKDEARKLLSDAEIDANIAGIESVFRKFLGFGDGAERRGDGQQRRLALPARLYRFPARLRTPFQRQPHAEPWIR